VTVVASGLDCPASITTFSGLLWTGVHDAPVANTLSKFRANSATVLLLIVIHVIHDFMPDFACRVDMTNMTLTDSFVCHT
jgi:hypothetical protein